MICYDCSKSTHHRRATRVEEEQCIVQELQPYSLGPCRDIIGIRLDLLKGLIHNGFQTGGSRDFPIGGTDLESGIEGRQPSYRIE